MKAIISPIAFITDHCDMNKVYGISQCDAEGNTLADAQSIYEALKQISPQVEYIDDIDYFVSNIAYFKKHIVISTRYGIASRNSKALIPAVCESEGIEYIGADSYTSMICNDKYLSKRYLAEFGLLTAPSVLIRDADNPEQLSQLSFLRYPIVAKPNYGGGSNGIGPQNIKYSYEDAVSFVKQLHQYQRQPILVEEYIPGIEVEVIIFGDQKRVLLYDEVQLIINGKDYFTDSLFDLEVKKIEENSVQFVNGTFIDANEKEKMIQLFQSFQKVEIMRVDCRIVNGHAYVIELSPDCYLGKDGGVYFAFQHKGFSFTDMFALLIKNSITPGDIFEV